MNREQLIHKIARRTSRPRNQDPLFRWRGAKPVVSDELSEMDWAKIRSLPWSRKHSLVIEMYIEDGNALVRGRVSEKQYTMINRKLRRLNLPYRLCFDRKYPASTPFNDRLVNICVLSLN